MGSGNFITGGQYADFLATQVPVYDTEIVKDIRPWEAGLVGYYSTSTFEAFTDNVHIFDRLRAVYPDTTQPWYPRPSAGGPGVPPQAWPGSAENGLNCVSNQCDLPPNKITWGTTRQEYQLSGQAWESDILCLDEMMPKTLAKQHFAQIITDVLTPASQFVTGDYLLKQALYNGNVAPYGNGPQVCTNTGFSPFTFSWDGGNPAATDPAGSQGYKYLTTSADPTSKLTPLMLQSIVNQQWMLGALKRSPEAMLGKLQVHTDNDTLYSWLQGNPTINDRVRYNDAAAFETGAKEFYKYGFNGTVGDYNVKVLPFIMRFNQVSAGRYQIVQPYVNAATTLGFGDTFNQDYINAQYQISYVNHPMSLMFKPFRPGQVNKMMPFMIRDYAGKWQFGIDNLGADAAGIAINNVKRNKGKFFADFRFAMKATHPEWLIPIFHLREGPCVYGVSTCNPSPGYPAQNYSSAPTQCPYILQWPLVIDTTTNVYTIPANTTTLNGNLLTHVQITGATGALLATALNANATLAALGTWAATTSSDGQNTPVLQLTAPAGAQNRVGVTFLDN
jgi:hypothetical protein